MKKLCTILLYVFSLLNTTVAQKLSVESFVLAPTDITAQTEGRKDLNGDACALVKIFVVGDVADVEGNVVKPLVKKNSQTWAFMTQGSKQMQVIAQNALPLMVTFADYGIGKLESNRTYILTLNQVNVSISAHSTSNVMPSKSTISPQATSSSPAIPSGSVISIPVKDGIGIEMVKVEAGSFDMGAAIPKENKFKSYLFGNKFEHKRFNDKDAVHRVTLTNNYYLGEYEVTQALWQAVMGNNPSNFKGDNLPVEKVSWDDCQKFISKLNAMTGKQFRLPTEAEWEYAARGGNKSCGNLYSGSYNIDDVAWYHNNSGSKTHSVGTKDPNELGLYDMTGNVSEWCQDNEYPGGVLSVIFRVARGGGWEDNSSSCCSSWHKELISTVCASSLGFRLALSE